MEDDSKKQLVEQLLEKHACYVLVTCSEPCDEGQMQVEMSYQGDPTLAAYLLEGAQRYIDEQCGLDVEEPPPPLSGPKLYTGSP